MLKIDDFNCIGDTRSLGLQSNFDLFNFPVVENIHTKKSVNTLNFTVILS